ncbi:MAG: hypothetical protein N2Z74_06240, partial [Syntrophales bacterium]|nr:hypothetical protein [Syntrophales bacterium]
MSSVKFCIVLWSFLLFIATPVLAQPPHPPFYPSTPTEGTQKNDGGTTSQVVQAAVTNPTIIIPDTFTEPAPLTRPTEEPAAVTTGAGLTILWSSHVKSYVLPLSYKLNPDFKIEANIPYIYKELKGEYTGEELRANGLGAVSYTHL